MKVRGFFGSVLVKRRQTFEPEEVLIRLCELLFWELVPMWEG